MADSSPAESGVSRFVAGDHQQRGRTPLRTGADHGHLGAEHSRGFPGRQVARAGAPHRRTSPATGISFVATTAGASPRPVYDGRAVLGDEPGGSGGVDRTILRAFSCAAIRGVRGWATPKSPWHVAALAAASVAG